MKITINLDGSLIIDGDYNTLITGRPGESPIEIIGGNSEAKHLITNFVIDYNKNGEEEEQH